MSEATTAVTTTATLRDFITSIFPDPEAGLVEMRALDPGAGKVVAQVFGKPDDIAGIAAFLSDHRNHHCYFGVATRVARDGKLAGTREHCDKVWTLYADMDFKAYPGGEAEARDILRECPCPPSLVVMSGGGLQPYFFLKDPVRADETLKTWLRRLSTHLKADLKAAEPARVLRVPGSVNHKYEPPRLVTVEEYEPGRVYTLAHFDWLPEEPKPATGAAYNGPSTQSIGVCDPDRAIKILASLWPDNGVRHEFAQALGGFCGRNGICEDDAVSLVRQAAMAVGDVELHDRERAVRDSYRSLAAGRTVFGFSRASDIAPTLRDVIPALNEALGIVPVPRITVEEAEEPVTLAPIQTPRLPEECRLGLAKNFADFYSEAYESSWESFYFAFLTHLGARLAKHVRLDNALKAEPRLYTILLGQSALARKSSAIKTIAEEFLWADLGKDPEEAAGDECGFPVIDGVGSGEGLAERIELAPTRSVLLQIDEFAHLTSKMKIEGNSLISILLTLFDKTTWNNVTKGKSYAMRGVSLSLLTACVDRVYPTLFDPKGGADYGIVNRLWLASGPSSATPKPSPRPDPSDQGALRRALRQYLVGYGEQKPGERLPFIYSTEAARIHEDWYRGEFYPSRDGYMSRLDTYCERLMLLLAICTDPTPERQEMKRINPEVAQAAVGMVRWQYQLRQQWSPIIAETQSAKIEQMILRVAKAAGKQGLSEREHQRLTSAHRVGITPWRKVYEALKANGNLVLVEGSAGPASPLGGRPAGLRYRYAFGEL
jgi:hypothetical protein